MDSEGDAYPHLTNEELYKVIHETDAKIEDFRRKVQARLQEIEAHPHFKSEHMEWAAERLDAEHAALSQALKWMSFEEKDQPLVQLLEEKLADAQEDLKASEAKEGHYDACKWHYFSGKVEALQLALEQAKAREPKKR